MHQNPSDDELRALLERTQTIAVVGASSSPERPSNGVMRRLLAAGFTVIPVNPNEREVLGQRAYASLREVPVPVDLVDVFRRAKFTEPVADEAIAIGAKALWLQQGIVNEATAAKAEAAGLVTVMDLCLAVEVSLRGVRKV